MVSTSRPKYLNTSIIGTSGLSQFSRLSSNNGRWAIADELRVPTNADNKIHGRVSLPVGLYDSRPAWDNEATVTIEVESPSERKSKNIRLKRLVIQKNHQESVYMVKTTWRTLLKLN